MVGTFDWGLRYALYRKWTGGFWQTHGAVNNEVWRHWLPLFAAGFVTSFATPPMEVAQKAYVGDKTFPEHLRYKYTSVLNALVRIAARDPFALYKNAFPSMAGSFVGTTMLFGIHDFFYDLIMPLASEADCPSAAVKGVCVNKVCWTVLIFGVCVFVSSCSDNQRHN